LNAPGLRSARSGKSINGDSDRISAYLAAGPVGDDAGRIAAGGYVGFRHDNA
jgi:hypothetical protein